MSTILQFSPAIEQEHLLGQEVFKALKNWHGSVSVNSILVAEIDSNFAGGNAFCERYNIPFNIGANCFIIEAVRSNNRALAACVVPVNTKIDFNGYVRKLLNARRVSFAPLEEVLQQSQMEHGSITPLGLPKDWLILIDSNLVMLPQVIVGAGKVNAKLALPGKALLELPNVQIIEKLGVS